MKGIPFLPALGACALAAAPLRVVSVDRPGLPPYEDDQRVYRLEGPECRTLRVGEILPLRRQGEPRRLGKLEVLSVHLDHADARLAEAGETFPLKGDEALCREPLRALPLAASASPSPLPAMDALRPLPPRPAVAAAKPLLPLPETAPVSFRPLPARTALLPRLPGPAIHRLPLPPLPGMGAIQPGVFAPLDDLRPARTFPPAAVGPGKSHRAPIFFIKEDASLSPGAYDKLRLWVATWGTEGRWSLECPKGADKISSLRLSALRSELQRLGIPSLGLDVRSLPREPGARYDAIYVRKEP